MQKGSNNDAQGQDLASRLAHFFWRRRWIFLSVLAIAVVIFGTFAPRVRPDNSLEAITVEHDPTLVLLKRVEKQFGSEEFISIAFTSENIFSAKSLQIVDAISRAAEKVEGVARVLSLTKLWRLENAYVDGEPQLGVVDFVRPEWIQNGAPPAQIPNLLKHPLFQKMIYSPDGKATAVFVQLKVIGSDDVLRSRIVAAMRQIAKEQEMKTGIKFNVWGSPVIYRDTFGAVESEQNVMPAFMLLAIFVLMYFSYRSFFIAASPLILLGLVFTIVIGTLGLMDRNFNWLTSIVPAVIMIVSLCDTMHVVNEHVRSGKRGEGAVRDIFRSVGVPSLVASLTTAIGFLSLLTIPIRPVREFGVYVAFGVMLAYFFTFTVFILIVNYGPQKFQSSATSKAPASIMRCLDYCLNLSLKYPRKILWVTVLLLILGGIGGTQIQVNSDMLNIFKGDLFHLKESNDFLKKGAGGGVECYLLLESDTPGRFYSPDILRRMDTIATTLGENIDLILKNLSIADFAKYFNMVLHDNDPLYYRIPDTEAEIAQIFLLMEMEKDRTQWQSFVNNDYSAARIRTFAMVAEDSRQTLKLGDYSASVIAAVMQGAPDIRSQFTGRPFATANMMKLLAQAMVNSTITSALSIAVVLMFLYRSVKVGLIASVPNLITIVLGMGIMGFFGVKIDLATSMVFSIATGIADDDMVHMVWHMRRLVERGMSYEAALKETYDKVGIPIITSTIVLVGGYFMLSLSKVWPTTLLGILVGVCCIIALFATILVSSALILVLRPFKMKALQS